MRTDLIDKNTKIEMSKEPERVIERLERENEKLRAKLQAMDETSRAKDASTELRIESSFHAIDRGCSGVIPLLFYATLLSPHRSPLSPAALRREKERLEARVWSLENTDAHQEIKRLRKEAERLHQRVARSGHVTDLVDENRYGGLDGWESGRFA